MWGVETASMRLDAMQGKRPRELCSSKPHMHQGTSRIEAAPTSRARSRLVLRRRKVFGFDYGSAPVKCRLWRLNQAVYAKAGNVHA